MGLFLFLCHRGPGKHDNTLVNSEGNGRFLIYRSQVRWNISKDPNALPSCLWQRKQLPWWCSGSHFWRTGLKLAPPALSPIWEAHDFVLKLFLLKITREI